jgi:HEAT repeat protein
LARPQSLPFDEPITRRLLGTIATAMFSNPWHPSAALARKELDQIVPRRGDELIAFAQRMHFLLIARDGAIQFIHLRLRDFCAIPGLAAVLHAGDKFNSSSAAKALGEIGYSAAVPELGRALLRLRDPRWRTTVVKILTEVGHAIVPRLIGEWYDRNRSLRQDAAAALGRIGDAESRQFLRSVLPDPHRGIRWVAARELARLGDSAAIPELLVHLDSVFSVERPPEEAALPLAGFGPAAVPPLLSTLREEDPKRRAAAASGLGWIADPVSLPDLLECLHDQDSSVQLSAVFALGKIKDAAAVPALLEIAQDDRSSIQWAVLEVLGALRDRRALPPMIAALEHHDADVRWHAATALGKMGDFAAADALMKASRSKDTALNHAAVSALGEIGDSRAVPFLLEAVRDREREWSAVFALARIKGPGVAAVLELARDPHVSVRSSAVGALEITGDPTVISVLVRALWDPESEVWGRAKEALRRIGSPAIPFLLDSLRQPNPPSQFRYAVDALLPWIGLRAEYLLAVALDDENPLVVKTAAKALHEMGSAAGRAALEAHPRAKELYQSDLWVRRVLRLP